MDRDTETVAGPRRMVLIMTDTQRADMLGCYGNPQMHTPNLDRLASEGIRFDRAYCCQPVCGPARAALFTGTWPHINNGWANSMALDGCTRTLGQRLLDEGLHTAYIGKWHLDGGDYFGDGVCPPGWDPDYWYDMRCYLEELSEADRFRSRQVQTITEGGGIDEAFTFGHRCSNRAIEFLEKHGDEDFLLVVSYDEPHHPHLCPKRYVELHRDTALPTRPNVFDPLDDKPEHHRLWARRRGGPPEAPVMLKSPLFFGCNSFVDDEIGRVLAAVDRHAPDALVIYTADHGSAQRSHGLGDKGPAMYDEITRIPLIVRWPGVAPAGAVCPHVASHIDVVPTLLDAAGCDAPKPIQGVSMVPTLRDPAKPARERVYIEYGRYEIDHDGFGGFQPIRCVRDARYKLVVNLLATDELYDLQADPYEMKNLIDEPAHAAARDALHDRLIDWMNETRDPFRGYYWQRRPWRADAPPADWDFTGMTRQREPDTGDRRQLDYGTGLPMEEATRRK